MDNNLLPRDDREILQQLIGEIQRGELNVTLKKRNSEDYYLYVFVKSNQD